MRRLVALAAFLVASSAIPTHAIDVSQGGIGRWAFGGDSITGYSGGWYQPFLVDANAFYSAPTFAHRQATGTGRAAVAAGGSRMAAATVGHGSGIVYPLIVPVPAPSSASGGMIIFAGVAGNTVAQLLARITTDVINTGMQLPTHVFLEIGVNDMRNTAGEPTDPTAFRTSCDSLLSTLKAGLPSYTQIVWLLPYYCTLNCTDALTDQYDTIILAAVNAAGGNVLAVDWRNITPRVDTDDGLHPSAIGRQQVSDYTWAQISKN